jgi:hypothetical protein
MFQSMRMLQSADLVAQRIWVGFARPNLSLKLLVRRVQEPESSRAQGIAAVLLASA